MRKFVLRVNLITFMSWSLFFLTAYAYPPLEYTLSDLSHFQSASKSWTMVGDVSVNLKKPERFITKDGAGILLNLPTRKAKGEDLFTKKEFGDIELELNFLMPKEGNSGIYLQGRYEVQLEDTWFSQNATSASNGGIYNLAPPRFSVSKAPGLWQKLKISFQAPKFDQAGKKIENAKIRKVELNGVTVQEDVELPAPTPGAVSTEEVPLAPLRIQGDHGPVAFKDIVVTENPEINKKSDSNFISDPIWVEGSATPILRSFMDIGDGVRVTHAVSVAGKEGLHYTYDLDHGVVLQVWRGGFLDATPMWDGRGNGTSRPLGVVQKLSDQRLQIASLADEQADWPVDTAQSDFISKGYTVDTNNIPTFIYHQYGNKISDRSEVVDNGAKLHRVIRTEGSSEQLYVLLAEDEFIEEQAKGEYIIGDQSYYLTIDDVKSVKPFIREKNGKKQLLVSLKESLGYSVIL